MTEANEISLADELEHALARAGIALPDDRRQAVLRSYAELRRHVAKLHEAQTSAEPSNVFHVMSDQVPEP